MGQDKYQSALAVFSAFLSQKQIGQEVKDIIASRETVLVRYKPEFQYENIKKISEETFRSFLYLENNHHWSGLFRHVTSLCADMNLMRETLSILVNPDRPLVARFDEAVGRVRGLGKALATAILLVSSPNEYGVWNNTSETALRESGLWREFVRGRTPGQQYEKINTLLKRLAKDLGIDLWTLDAIMWGLLPKGDSEGLIKTPANAPEPPTATYSFLADIQHPYLQSRLARLSHVPLDTLLREAGVVFETHLREKVDPDGSMFGTGLVEEALKPGGRIVFSTHKGEQEGVQNLYKGAMQFIRNPPMHKIIDYPESMAEQYLRLIDSLMILLDEATKTQ